MIFTLKVDAPTIINNLQALSAVKPSVEFIYEMEMHGIVFRVDEANTAAEILLALAAEPKIPLATKEHFEVKP